MKTVRKLLTALLVLMYIISTSGNVVAEGEPISVDSLEVEYEKNINVSLTNEIDTDSLGYDDVKILHDISILTSELDSADPRKVIINLDQEISENSVYNIISIDGAEGNMDFSTGTSLDGEEIYNEVAEGIESITIIDPKNIEITFFEGITETEVNLKLFKDIPVDSINSISSTEMAVTTIGKFTPSNNYIFMLIAAKNADNSDAEIENGIYNFETPSSLEEAPVKEELDLNAASEEAVEEQVEEVAEETVVTRLDTVEKTPVEPVEEAVNETVEETTTEENVTKATTTDSSEVVEEESNIAEVAAEATAVPETGAASGILMFITMLLAFGMHMKKRK